ncbi:MAG: sensor histidine kinase [Saprospiraceae bacterium]|nr:sensor histidine kinase [Saprospiraceae bacterium]
MLRLIGRELISDRITAVYELVKNCYDANAKEVYVEFEDDKIIVRDDGLGMTFEDIRDKWMVVGTDSKRAEHFSPEPFRRRYVGEKGIGRFATDKLGRKLLIKTKKEGHDFWLFVEIDWAAYEQKTNESKFKPTELPEKIEEENNQESGLVPISLKNIREEILLFTDVENNYWFEETSHLSTQGTSLIMSGVRDEWTDKDLEHLNKELSKFVSPFYGKKTPFQTFINSDQHKGFKNLEVRSVAINLASHIAEIKFGIDDQTNEEYQEFLSFDESSGQIKPKRISKPIFGFIQMKLYFFNKEAKAKYNRAYPNKEDRIDGIRIYRDGIVTTPFAENEDDPMKRRDILGIDKRLWQDTFTRIGTREVIGFVEITKDGNPQIIDATNRQDFVDTPEYRALKEIIIDQLDVFSKVKIFQRKRKELLNEASYRESIKDLRTSTKLVEQIEKQNPTLAADLAPLKGQLESAIASSKRNLDEQKKMHEEFLRRENIYLSLMSLQEYAAALAHAVRTTVGQILRMAEFFVEKFPNPKYDSNFKEYAKQIYDDMLTLNRVTDFMLSYAGSNLEFEELNLKVLIERLFHLYRLELEKEKITVHLEIDGNIVLFANQKFFEEVIQNLISNSIKALKDTENKRIKLSGWAEDDHFIFYFSDNGPGIRPEIRDKVFDLFYTETAKEGGAGVGLWIVKTRLESLAGKVKIVENEMNPTGTTFQITLPFSKN